MGIFTRFRDIVSSNINAMLDRAEEPEKLIRLMIREMEDTLVELKAACAGVMAETKKIQRQRDEADDRARFWADKAQLAALGAREVLSLGQRRRARARRGRHRAPLAVTATYQDSCHLAHGQRITREPRELLRLIPGVELVELPESSWCCGSAGIYNITQPEMSHKLLARKIRHILATGADPVKRYCKLADICREQGFEAEREFFEKSAANLAADGRR